VLVVVHLVAGKDVEAKRHELEDPLAEPRGHVDQQGAAGGEQPVALGDHLLRSPQVLEHREAGDHVERLVGELGEHALDPPFDRRHPRQPGDLVGERDVDQHRRVDQRQHAAREAGLEATAEVAEAGALEARHPADGKPADPSVEAVEAGQLAALAERLVAGQVLRAHGSTSGRGRPAARGRSA
jgi:hypothetical protein